MATKVKSSTKATKSKKSTIVTNPQLPEIDDVEIVKMLDVDRIDDFIEENYKKYTYTTEDEIQRKATADKKINELRAKFVSDINTLYEDYKDTGKDNIRKKADELIEQYKLDIESALNGAMFVYKMAPVPTEEQVIEARKRTASVPVPVVKRPPSSYTGKERKLIEKVRQAENYTAELNELDTQIAGLDESYKNIIEEEIETLNQWGDKKMAEVVDRYKFKKEEEEKIQDSKAIKGVATDKELQLSIL
jgi:vacuolar-type H+-ATPase subunit H